MTILWVKVLLNLSSKRLDQEVEVVGNWSIPKVESYLEGLCVKFHAQTLSSLGEISEELSEIRKRGFHHFKNNKLHKHCFI